MKVSVLAILLNLIDESTGQRYYKDVNEEACTCLNWAF